MEAEPTVFIVDDDPAVRESLGWLFTSAGLRAEAYANAEALIAGVKPTRPGCILLDIRLPGGDGLSLQDVLRQRSYHQPIIILTGFADIAAAVRALKNGAFDFIEKPVADEELLARINRALALGQGRRALRRQRGIVLARVQTLTDRERDVLELTLAGLPIEAVGQALGISGRTVEVHRGNLMKKLGVTSLADLFRLMQVAKSPRQ